MSLASPRMLALGERIDQAGVYDLPMSVYHSDCCDGPSVSSSGLRTIWAQSAAHYWADSYLNPHRLEDDTDRRHFSLGRAAHHLLFLGRKGFDEEYVVRPSVWADWRTKDAKEWRADQLKAGKTILTDGELEQITGMARSLAEHPLVRAGILDGYVERSLIWQEPISGVWLKSRPDCIPNDSGDYADLKTTTSVATEDLARSIASFGYHAQGALTGLGSQAVLNRPMQTFTLVFVEVKPPHCVRIVTIPPEDIRRGEQQILAAVETFAECWKSGVWHGPGGSQADAEYLPLPTWARTSIDNRLEQLSLEAVA